MNPGNAPFLARALTLAALGALFAGCAATGSKPGALRAPALTFTESTQFLGANGEVVTLPSRRAAARAAEKAAYWRGDGVPGSPSITIDLDAQTAAFYKGAQLVGSTPISSGNASNPTPRGRFRVIQKDRDHRSNLYGNYVDAAGNPVVENVDVNRDKRPEGTSFLGARMPYFLRFHGGAGLHAGFLPGFPDSHGCVRLPDRMAEIFFENARNGTPVLVIN